VFRCPFSGCTRPKADERPKPGARAAPGGRPRDYSTAFRQRQTPPGGFSEGGFCPDLTDLDRLRPAVDRTAPIAPASGGSARSCRVARPRIPHELPLCRLERSAILRESTARPKSTLPGECVPPACAARSAYFALFICLGLDMSVIGPTLPALGNPNRKQRRRDRDWRSFWAPSGARSERCWAAGSSIGRRVAWSSERPRCCRHRCWPWCLTFLWDRRADGVGS